MEEMEKLLAEVFPGSTTGMWRGDEPVGAGATMADGGTALRWKCRCGGGQTYNGRVISGEISINCKVTLSIVGDTLHVCDIRHAGKPDAWVYWNTDTPPYGPRRNDHELEPERLDQYLHAKIDGGRFGEMFMERARELAQIKAD